MSHTLWSVGRSSALALSFVFLWLPIGAGFFASPADVRCEHGGGLFSCKVTDRWPLAEPGRGVAVRAVERCEVVKGQLVWKTAGGDVALRVPREHEIDEADLKAAAEQLTAAARDPAHGPVALTLRAQPGLALVFGALALVFYGLIIRGAGANAVFSIESGKLVVQQRRFGLVRKTLEFPASSVSDVQLTQVRSLYRVELVLNDGRRVFVCTVSYGRGKAEAAKVLQLLRSGAVPGAAP